MTNNKNVHVKWAGPNTAEIKLLSTKQSVCLSKRELCVLAEEIKQFVEFYQEHFSETNIDVEDIIDEPEQYKHYVEP